MKTYKYSNGMSANEIKSNNNADGRYIRHQHTIALADGRTFYQSNTGMSREGLPECYESVNHNGQDYLINLNNGRAYRAL